MVIVSVATTVTVVSVVRMRDSSRGGRSGRTELEVGKDCEEKNAMMVSDVVDGAMGTVGQQGQFKQSKHTRNMAARHKKKIRVNRSGSLVSQSKTEASRTDKYGMRLNYIL